MPDFDLEDFDDSFNSRVRDSNNSTTTTNNTSFAADLDNVGNTDDSVNGSGNVMTDIDGVGNADNSVNGSGNTDVSLDGVGNVDSHDETVGIDGSYNDNSDNGMDDHSDNSANGSYNDHSLDLVSGSFNSYLDESVDDHSIEVGSRSYDTGFGDVSLGSAGGGSGDVWVNNQNTIVDQSFNGNVEGWGEVSGAGGSTAVVASGNGSIAAGNDVNLSQSVDRSTEFTAGGDVNYGNTTEIVNVIGSHNSEVDGSSWTDSSTDTSVEDSFNDESQSWTADDSFNEELTSSTESTWDVDADVIWGSEDAAIGDVSVPDMGFDS